MITAETYNNPCGNADAMFFSCKSQFREKNPILPFEKFPFLALARNTIMLTHLILFSLHYLSTGRLREVKNKGNFQTFSYKSGRGRLREVPNMAIWLANCCYFGKLAPEVRVTRGGRNRRLDCIRKLWFLGIRQFIALKPVPILKIVLYSNVCLPRDRAFLGKEEGEGGWGRHKHFRPA